MHKICPIMRQIYHNNWFAFVNSNTLPVPNFNIAFCAPQDNDNCHFRCSNNFSLVNRLNEWRNLLSAVKFSLQKLKTRDLGHRGKGFSDRSWSFKILRIVNLSIFNFFWNFKAILERFLTENFCTGHKTFKYPNSLYHNERCNFNN